MRHFVIHENDGCFSCAPVVFENIYVLEGTHLDHCECVLVCLDGGSEDPSDEEDGSGSRGEEETAVVTRECAGCWWAWGAVNASLLENAPARPTSV